MINKVVGNSITFVNFVIINQGEKLKGSCAMERKWYKDIVAFFGKTVFSQKIGTIDEPLFSLVNTLQ